MYMDYEKQLENAKTTSDVALLRKLRTCVDFNVRRAVARNRHTTSDILELLCLDPVMNVSYMASLHPNSPLKREYNEKDINPCVMCEHDERSIECSSCESKKYFYIRY